jgi:DNA (cytosine-5)-methyltransferase 1
MKYFSTFSGIGGFELGIGVDHECVGYSEIDKYAVQIYQKHFPNHKNYGDITKIDETKLPDFDLFVGGFPCQSFSIAGKRGGFDDTRGTMFFEIARIVREKQPRLLLLENVKGLLSHDKGATFYTIISTLDELGYDCEWQVLNSKNHGVPQNRERVFIIGHLRGTSRPEVFPITGADTEVDESSGVQQNADGRLISRTLLARDYKDPKLVQINQPVHSNDRVYGVDGVSPTLNTMQGGNRQPFIAPVLTPDRIEKRQNGRRFKENGEPSFTLTAQDKHGIYDGKQIRRLTPIECERLQGFPDGWTEGVSDTQRYKTLGNAVTVTVVRDIMEKLLV